VSYAVTSSLISLDRVALKSRVVDSPEIRSVIGHVPALESCLNALYDCNYREFFRVSVFCWEFFLGCENV
jgi:26S proteasome regulatory subunit N7